MITLKIKYKTTKDGLNLIQEYRKQYSSVLHYAYNRRYEGVNEKETEKQISLLNNIQLIQSYLKRCAVKHATQLIETDDKKRIFGGKKNFIARCKGKISRDEFLQNRLCKLYVIGEANRHSNRFVTINEDLESFTFKPTRKDKIILTINGRYKRYKSTLNKLYHLQQDKQIPITYELDNEYIYLTYDEGLAEQHIDYKPIKNRVFAIDLNPNYIGWSVVDWKSSSEFEVIKSVSSGFLPATTLSEECYGSMFSGCKSLTQAPELPATTLVDSCYNYMFEYCTSLTQAPELPATTLVGYCYYYMFTGCSKLNYIKAMFTTKPSSSYTSNWVKGVASTGTFVKNKNATWNTTGVNGIPSGWTVQKA